MAVSGSIYFTGAFAILLGGLYWKRATTPGAFAAMAVGAIAVIGLKPVQKLLHIDAWLEARELTGTHIGLTISALAIVAMVAVSLVTKPTNQIVENS